MVWCVVRVVVVYSTLHEDVHGFSLSLGWSALAMRIRAPKSLRWRRGRLKAGNDPYSAASRQAQCVHSLTAWNVASKCGCKSALHFSTSSPNLSIPSFAGPVRATRTHLDAVLPCGRDHLAAVELKRHHPVVVLDRLEGSTSSEVPDLFDCYRY